MRTRLTLSLSDARAMVAAAEAYAIENDLRVSIAVVDESTYLQCAIRMDGAGCMSMEGAIEKARSAAEGGHPTKWFEDSLKGGNLAILKIPGITPVEGGIPAFAEGECCGAIGVSGALPHLDSAVAEAGLAALQASVTVSGTVRGEAQ